MADMDFKIWIKKKLIIKWKNLTGKMNAWNVFLKVYILAFAFIGDKIFLPINDLFPSETSQ
jgi:hypothetical protein